MKISLQFPEKLLEYLTEKIVKMQRFILFISEANVLRVLNLNTWGLGWPISSDHKARFRALREVLAHSEYDVILLQEVWYRRDHELLRSAIPHSTYFGIFNSGCSGYLLPLGCSGLTILSRHPLQEVEFTPFKVSFKIMTSKCPQIN